MGSSSAAAPSRRPRSWGRALAIALVWSPVLLGGCATLDSESRENQDASFYELESTPAPPPPPPARKPKPGDGTLKGRIVFRAAEAKVNVASLLTQTGATAVEFEIAGQHFPISSEGTFDARLDSGSFRIDHVELLGPGERRRAIFFAPFLVDVQGAAACLGRFELSWGSVKELIRLDTPKVALIDACPADVLANTGPAPQLPFPELADPLWVRALSVPYLALVPSFNGALSTQFSVGGRAQLVREPAGFGSLWANLQATFQPTAVRLTASVEYGPWQGWAAVAPVGGWVDGHPIVGGALILGPLKRELALSVHFERELVSGLPSVDTWSLHLQLSPFAFVGALL